ncbi:MAG: sarcosine oxidase subunit gamma [Pseudomonadota bacterium]|nr:MAG: sarcosine oxidase subunit gamma [Pseudomonadota bacterium]
MAEATLRPHSQLAGALAELAARHSAGAGPRLSESPFAARLMLRAIEPLDALNRRIGPLLGLALDDTPNRATESANLTVFWQRVDHWLIVAPDDRREALITALDDALADGDSSLVDLSDYYTTLLLEGERAVDVLMKGCSLDLHPRAFAVGDMALTRLAQADVMLHRSGERRYAIQMRRSFAEYALKWLFDAGLEYDIGVIHENTHGVES